ncbi:MAG: hypothetical protein HC869_18745 [Rhodospirillales bacterium]|nr:hypothetical protein [Rhodospirillales bacterium]
MNNNRAGVGARPLADSGTLAAGDRRVKPDSAFPVRFSLATAAAAMMAGAVPVLVDPGIDKRALKQCLDEAQAELLKRLFPRGDGQMHGAGSFAYGAARSASAVAGNAVEMRGANQRGLISQ